MGIGGRGTVFFACPGARWRRRPRTEENVSQIRIQFGNGMRTVTWDPGWQLSRVQESWLGNSGSRMTGMKAVHIGPLKRG